ncbi:unnamed protein product [Larinioides sclopetarius]|uniref:Fatty acid synthase n=1 Tax=Larinioides sclopetarius TaxID=280406 RepID=A0AAV2AJJ5_9ARAC
MDPSSDHHEYCTGGFDPEDIVISGIAGRFPECDNVGELNEALYSKKDLIVSSTKRFQKSAENTPTIPCGLLNNLDKFDAGFFGLINNVVNSTDPGGRIHLEVIYEAIADAGVDAFELPEQNIGLFNATTNEDCYHISLHDKGLSDSYFLRSFQVGRATFAFNITGPSLCVDTACSSSAVALWTAVKALKSGEIDAAVVSGCHLNLHPGITSGYHKYGIASSTGNSRPFDAGSDGMIRSEAVTAVFLQKAKFARRAYATVSAIRLYSGGHNSEGLTSPSVATAKKVLLDTLMDAKLDENEIGYVETHGTGTPVGDPIELAALSEAFLGNRSKPLLIGTIKSNIGHTEACAGLCGMIKAILTFENETIPPNIKYQTPNPKCPALLDGRIAVVTEPTPFKENYIPTLSAGITGTIVSVLLKKNPITYNKSVVEENIPRLILFSATTEEAISFLFDYIKRTPKLSNEFFALLNKLSFGNSFFKPFRGYGIFAKGENSLTQIKKVSPRQRKIWFVMTGMGCQWPGMGLRLMQIAEFAKSMLRSAEVLKPYGIDLLKVLKEGKTEPYKERNITASFVGICAIQIALIDVLKLLDIKADGIVGHSTGELACAYADGCCTAEEAILAAYYRGYSVENADLPQGRMAAVGLPWNEALKLCPKDVYAVCDNTDDSVTISGLKEPLEKFVETLKEKNIFARMVDAHGYSFHCEHILPVVPALRKAMNKLITNPKSRSERWISSSYPKSEWDTPECKTANAEYFVHNLMSNVLFKDAAKIIPPDAIIIEIGSHFLLQPLLRRIVGPEALYFGLMKRNEEDSIKFFMESLGKMYVEGVKPKIERLYPPVKFPVPRETPMISDLIRWDHSESYFVPEFTPKSGLLSREFNFLGRDSYILDHKVDRKVLFPATGYIFIAWETLASNLGKKVEELSVVIERFKIHRPTVIGQQLTVEFYIKIFDSSGRFEISEGNSVVASGLISECKDILFQECSLEYDPNSQSISGIEIYEQLKRLGYEYGPAFQSVHEVKVQGTSGLVQWKDRWIPFLDAILLFFALKEIGDQLFLPTGALRIKIDPKVLKSALHSNNDASGIKKQEGIQALPVVFNKKTRICSSVGVEIADLTAVPVPRRQKTETPIWEECNFIAYDSVQNMSQESLQEIQRYFRACNENINEICKTLEKDVEKHVFSVENNDNNCLGVNIESQIGENHHLLKSLKSASHVSNTSESKQIELFTHYMKFIGTDILNNTLVNEDTLRILLATIFENSFRRLSIIEINDSFPVILTIASEIVEKYNYMPFKKSILIADETIHVSEEILKKYRIQVFGEEKLRYMINDQEETKQDIGVGSFMCGSLKKLKELIHTLNSVIKKSGFIVLFFKEKLNSGELFLSSLCGEEFPIHTQSALETILQEENLVILSKISDSLGSSVYLLRFPCLSEPQRILIMDYNDYSWVKKVKQELFERNTGTVWLVAERNRTSGIIGMVKCLLREPGGERIRCILLSPTMSRNYPPSFSVENPFYAPLFPKDLVMNVWRDGVWGSFRHTQIRNVKCPRFVDHSYVKCLSYGNLSSFQWTESPIKYIEPKNDRLFHVYYSALNFRDVMIASGKLPAGVFKKYNKDARDTSICIEFSGIEDGTGKRVCGIGLAALATSVLANPALLIEVPDKWTLEEAATVPVVYFTCYYGLLMKAKLREGQSILIHSGTGGVGQAAINIALSLNCEIYTTVGTNEKKEYLRRKFPQIKEENIGSSRDTSFENMIVERTNGRGVDFVLNSLADDKFHASMRCVAENGCFIEIGKFDIEMDHDIGLKLFARSLSFIVVNLDLVFGTSMQESKTVQKLTNLFKEGIVSGVVKPLDRTVFDKNSIEKPFRYMTKGIHIGKVLIKIRDEENKGLTVPKSLKQLAIPDTLFYYNKVYIIIGGLGGFGTEVAKWIIKKGGRNIILTSRYGARTPFHYFCLKRWEEEGINVQVSTLNVVIKTEAEKLLKDASCIGKVGGIFNSALVLRDAFMSDQTADSFQEVCDPKAVATENLDELSRKLCPSLDHFVCFSSISCGRGNAGQTNYGYANSVMERVCEQRKRDGLPGLAIQWGIIGEVGIVHRHMGEDAMIAGFVPQSVQSCLESLDAFCQQDSPVVTSYVSSQQVKKEDGDLLSIISKLSGLDIAAFDDPTKSINEIGLDSFAKVELKHLIDSHTDLNLSLDEIRNMTVGDIKALSQKSKNENNRTSILFASETVNLPTVLKHKEAVQVLQNNVPGDPIFIVNIGDTDVSKFQTLATELKNPTFALVWTDDAPRTDIGSLASWYMKLIQEITTGPFHIVSHSIGGSVAFEMALQSQACEANLKTITLLDSLEGLIDVLRKEDIEEINSEVAALCKFVKQFTSGDLEKFKKVLTREESQEQRIQIVLRYLTDSSHHAVDKNELTDAITRYLQKYKLTSFYIPKGKLSLDINIIESSTKLLANDVARVKELLGMVCCGNISIHREFYSNQLTKNEDVKKIAQILQNCMDK